MFDLYYLGPKPNLFPHERTAKSLEDARQQSRTKFFWLVNGKHDLREFNFMWLPPKWEEHQTHIFLLQSQFEQFDVTLAPSELCPSVEHYYDRVYLPQRIYSEFLVTLKPEVQWIVDPTWVPNPYDPPYIYVLGNPWCSAEEMPTIEYRVPGATEYKYVNERVLSISPNTSCWCNLIDNIDTSTLSGWSPNPFDPPYIYVFGNQWYPAEEMATVEYTVPSATERKYVDEPRAKLLPTKKNWSVPEEVNASALDFSWVPHPKDPPFIYHFGSEFQMSVGLTYTAPNATELKFAGEPPTTSTEVKVVQTVNMFFVDMNNKSATTRYEALKLRYPEIQKIRFMNGWIETIKRCVPRSSTSKFWVISSENVYDDFNFEWHAQPWQTFMTHVFGSQWQKWSDTFLIGKNEFARHAKWAKSLEQFPNLNFVKDQKVYRPDDIYNIFYIDHFNPGSDAVSEKIQKRYPNLKKARYVDNYLNTFKRIMATAETDYVWIINSICDYSKFDFTWQPEPWQAKMLHVFPSDDQKFGDTFYVHVPSFKEQMAKLELLDWFETVNYCNDQTVPRLAIDIVNYDGDTVVDAVKAHDFTGPFAMFKHRSVANTRASYAPSIWRKKDRVIHVLSKSGSVLVVPRESKEYLDAQMYDYPYILPHKEQFIADKCLDIVYISNGEPDAERWYTHLVACAPKKKIHWVKDVTGRSEAYKAAANVSTTPWFFTVFAKLEINPEFDWDWQPDYMQKPKSYVFNALNPVNGLVYGHQGLICYNKNLVLSTNIPGLDFTLSKPHEVVDILSGVAHFNVDPWTTWRTAFREVLKLKEYSINNLLDNNASSRLTTWLTNANGENSDWCLRGANDAIEYYDSVNGQMDKLLLSFEWQWLREYFNSRYASG